MFSEDWEVPNMGGPRSGSPKQGGSQQGSLKQGGPSRGDRTKILNKIVKGNLLAYILQWSDLAARIRRCPNGQLVLHGRRFFRAVAAIASLLVGTVSGAFGATTISFCIFGAITSSSTMASSSSQGSGLVINITQPASSGNQSVGVDVGEPATTSYGPDPGYLAGPWALNQDVFSAPHVPVPAMTLRRSASEIRRAVCCV